MVDGAFERPGGAIPRWVILIHLSRMGVQIMRL